MSVLPAPRAGGGTDVALPFLKDQKNRKLLILATYLCRVVTVRLGVFLHQVSLRRPPNRTYTFSCIRLSDFPRAFFFFSLNVPACSSSWHSTQRTIVFRRRSIIWRSHGVFPSRFPSLRTWCT